MSAHGELVFLGCYTGESGGEGDGVALLRRDRHTGALTRLGVVARTPSPSFLTQHPSRPVLYAVNELDAGTVSAFSVDDDGSLTPLAVQETGGAHPCHLAVTGDGRFLLAANHSSGNVSVHPLDLDGAPGERTDLLDLAGGFPGPAAERPDRPRAHLVAPDPNSGDVLIADPGSDLVWRARLDPLAGRLIGLTAAIRTPLGTGPRHLVRSADGALLLVGERSGVLSWYRPAGARWELIGSASASTTEDRNQPSELAGGRDGRFVYVANRGADTVSTFAWDGAKATLIAEVPCGGRWPRHLALLYDHLYVANERSHTVTTFRLDPDTGLPGLQGEATPESSPACLLGWKSRIW